MTIYIFSILVITGVCVQLAAFGVFPYTASSILNQNPYAWLLVFFMCGTVLYFQGALVLPKNTTGFRLLVAMIMFYLVLVYLIVYLNRQYFFINCQPSYSIHDVHDQLQDHPFHVSQVDLGDGVHGLHIVRTTV
jgi:hypothetical protein